MNGARRAGWARCWSLALFAPFSLIASDLPRGVAWPAAFVACAWGVFDARRYRATPARELTIPAGRGAASCEGERIDALRVGWRARWRSCNGATALVAGIAPRSGRTRCLPECGVNCGSRCSAARLHRTGHRWQDRRSLEGSSMFKPVPVAIGLRYLRAKRRNGFISFISLASDPRHRAGRDRVDHHLAVMSGFQREIRDRMLQMAAHATVSGYGEPMEDWQRAVKVALEDPARRRRRAHIEKISRSSAPTASWRCCAGWCRRRRTRSPCSARSWCRASWPTCSGQLQDRARARTRDGWGEHGRRRAGRARRFPQQPGRRRADHEAVQGQRHLRGRLQRIRQGPAVVNLQDLQRLLRDGR